jgi:non-heme chloroperoxidase
MSRKRIIAAAASLFGLGLISFLWIEHELAWLKAQPDPYSLEALSKEPDGAEEFIPSVDGARLRAVSKGSGTPVVLIHGLSCSLLEWNVLWPMLVDAGYRVIAFDLRGHGKSTIGNDGMTSAAMARDVARILEHYKVIDGILVGHSLGGFISTVFLTEPQNKAGERLRGAVLVATFAGTILQGSPGWKPAPASPDGTWKESVGYAISWALVRSHFISWFIRTDAGHVLSRGMMGEKPFYSAIHAASMMMANHDFSQALPIMRASYLEDYYPKLKNIQIPCIAIGGSADTATRPWHTERMAREIPNARAISVPGTGHLLNWEAPAALVEAIRALGVSSPARGGSAPPPSPP